MRKRGGTDRDNTRTICSPPQKLEEKLTRLDLQEARTLQREQAHDEQIARDLAGVPGHFAHGLNFYKLFWVFFFAVSWEWSSRLFLLDRLRQAFTAHRPRVGGLQSDLRHRRGAAHRLPASVHRKSDRWIFIGGSIIGGAFEYFCSWLQETVLGTVSWDYTGYPFNLNGRINLLYCLFWGALALVWVKEVFPRLNGFIERRVSKPTVSSSVGRSSHLCLRTLL